MTHSLDSTDIPLAQKNPLLVLFLLIFLLTFMGYVLKNSYLILFYPKPQVAHMYDLQQMH